MTEQAASTGAPTEGTVVAPVIRDHRFQQYAPGRFIIIKTSTPSAETFEVRLQSLVHREVSQQLAVAPGKDFGIIGRNMRIEIAELASIELTLPQMVKLRDDFSRVISGALSVTPDTAREELRQLKAQIAVAETELSHRSWTAREAAGTPAAPAGAVPQPPISQQPGPHRYPRARSSRRLASLVGVLLLLGVAASLIWFAYPQAIHTWWQTQQSAGSPTSAVPMEEVVRPPGAYPEGSREASLSKQASPAASPLNAATEAGADSSRDAPARVAPVEGRPAGVTAQPTPPESPRVDPQIALETEARPGSPVMPPVAAPAPNVPLDSPAVTAAMPPAISPPDNAAPPETPSVTPTVPLQPYTRQREPAEPVTTAPPSGTAGTAAKPSTPDATLPGAVATKTGTPHLAVHVGADTWLRVRDAAGKSYIERVLRAGETWTVPSVPSLTLTTGNAASTFIVVDGVSGPPLGLQGAVRSQRLDQ